MKKKRKKDQSNLIFAGSSVTGEYSVIEPGGRVRVVSYHAGKDGFHAHVHTSGKNDHSSYQGHHNHQFLGSASSKIENEVEPKQEEEDKELQQYPLTFEAQEGY